MNREYAKIFKDKNYLNYKFHVKLYLHYILQKNFIIQF